VWQESKGGSSCRVRVGSEEMREFMVERNKNITKGGKNLKIIEQERLMRG
jgi:hypothetical protein